MPELAIVILLLAASVQRAGGEISRAIRKEPDSALNFLGDLALAISVTLAMYFALSKWAQS